MTVNYSLWTYFANADPMVKMVMLILMAASVVSWTFIIQRIWYFRQVSQAMRAFEEYFWSGTALTKLYTNINSGEITETGLTNIFEAGFKEYIRLRKHQPLDQKLMLESIERAMHVAASREVSKLEKHLSYLASIGSVSPYIGLFGTVWGIMNAFHALGSMQQASVAMVAPGISEALIATAMGLFAAIPAVLAYNRFSATVNQLLDNYDTFQNELICILQRQ